MALKLSLRTKLLLGIILVLAPIVVLLIWDFSSDYNAQQEEVLGNLQRLAEAASIIVDDNLQEAQALSQALATDPVIRRFDAQAIDEYLQRFVLIYPQYDSIGDLFDTQGNLVASSGAPKTENVADRDWFQELMRTRQTVFTGVILSRGTGKPIVGAVTPIIGNDGQVTGAVGVALSLSHLPQSFESLQRAPGQALFVADPKGMLAFHTSEEDLSWEQRDASAYQPIQTALQGQTFVSENTGGVFGTPGRMVVVVPTPRFGWAVGITIAVNDALAPVRASLARIVIIFLITLVLSLALALGLAELIVGPIKRLASAARALGRGDLQRRVSIHTGDELEELGGSFNAMADEVQRALRLREEFLSVASHELRTPLTVIKGYAQWLHAKETNDDKRRVHQIIVKQADRIGELLDEMLSVSEIQGGRLELHPERFDLVDLARELTDKNQLIREDHHLLLHGEGPIMVNADRNRVEVVLTNLIDNAVRYSPRGRDVNISISKEREEATVCVQDQGMGIPADKQALVFEPFFQVQPTIAGFGGMGLGLFISKKIVEKHGGRMWFNTEEGKGSTFCFSLPKAEQAVNQI